MDEKAKRYKKLSIELNLLDRKDPKAAISKAEEIAMKAREAGQEGYALFFEGEALCFEGNYKEAEKIERKALELLPDTPFILSNYGTLFAYLGNFDQALEFAERSLALDPDHKQGLQLKGTCLSTTDQFEHALPVYEQALDIDPNDSYTLTSLGIIHIRLNEYKKGLEYFLKSKEKTPWDENDLLWVAEAYKELRMLDEAEDAAKKWIELQEKKAHLLNKGNSDSELLGKNEKNYLLEKKKSLK